LIVGTVLVWWTLWEIQVEWNCSIVQSAQSIQIMLLGFMHWKHLVLSSNFPPQFRHDSSGNSFQIKLMKIGYKQHVEVVQLKAQ